MALRSAVIATAVVAALGVGRPRPAPQSRLPQGAEQVHLNPADFTTRITNPVVAHVPRQPLGLSRDRPGRQQAEGCRDRDQPTKLIANGVSARVVRDVVTEEGKFVEVTDDWYAQDTAGNVWYLGEATTEYSNGKPVTTPGSFEAGVDGAQPGVIMAAHPRPGLRYRQEYYKGQAEDRARVVGLREEAEVPFGHFGPALKAKDFNPFQPAAFEIKFYARGIGPVLALSVSGGSRPRGAHELQAVACPRDGLHRRRDRLPAGPGARALGDASAATASPTSCQSPWSSTGTFFWVGGTPRVIRHPQVPQRGCGQPPGGTGRRRHGLRRPVHRQRSPDLWPCSASRSSGSAMVGPGLYMRITPTRSVELEPGR